MDGFFEGVLGGGEIGGLEGELKELVGLEAIGVGGEEAAEDTFDEGRGEEGGGDLEG